ncbi:DUF3854 domain-containing protein [Micromonospora peucetia]|uniref:Uncharacterized protein n=1 Tax=Micromonospora peucetia TaxID=47871 RepID=A0A1C6V488_9ACTN|nr:DUF3854 domain-containing protein [Micromonospora peucetia]SCL61055.1 protein of unknown function (DUF3854) [Micromonospora peucetia]
MAELAPDHREFLAAQAVNPDLAEKLGVRSLTGKDDLAELGEDWQNWANFPAIAFPWTNEEGRTEYQIRPDNPTEDQRDGRLRKYVFRSKDRGYQPVLWAVRPVNDHTTLMLIVEGTKQALAAASYAPQHVAVYAIGGCRMWQREGLPIGDLMVAEDQEVVILLDADASSNLDVYEAGVKLGGALTDEGATSVGFARMTGVGEKDGLDDVLGARPEGRRASYLARIIEAGRKHRKPADKAPVRKKATTPTEPPRADGDRAVVVVNEDRLTVINSLTAALVDRFSGVTLFNHGEVISELKGSKMTPVDKGRFNNVIQQAARTLSKSEGRDGTTYVDAWPEDKTMAAVLSEAEKFTPLEHIATTPFVRPDGSVCTTAGYDDATRSLLVPDEVLEKVEVPENPTAADVEAARDLLLVEWLGDFPWDTTADRANMLALIITPFIRSLVPLVPLAVVDGTGKGVGKNLLADCISILFTGQRDAQPMPYTKDDEEHRKVITSAFREGSSLFIFDEAHEIEGANFARAITSMTYQDRVLGVSRMARFPNRVTWISLGNNVKVEGDMIRRVYRIRIDPKTANPEDRPSSSFRHPGLSGLDLRSWTEVNRAALLRAVLVLVRAWFAQGQKKAVRAESFGSFEVWEGIVGGICAMAGVPGFLGNLKAWRGTSNFSSSYWSAHLEWLFEQFGNGTFFAAEVKRRALADPEGFQPPPDNEDTTSKGFARVLGQQYAGLAGQWYDGLQIVRTGTGKGERVKWAVEGSPVAPQGSEGSERSEPLSSNLPWNTTPVVVVEVEEHVSHGEAGPEPSDRSDPSDPPTGPPVDWVPSAPGDGVAGYVTELSEDGDEEFGGLYPVVILRTRTGLVRITGSPPALRRALADATPEVGNAIGVKFLGERPINGDPNRKAGQYRVIQRAKEPTS